MYLCLGGCGFGSQILYVLVPPRKKEALQKMRYSNIPQKLVSFLQQSPLHQFSSARLNDLSLTPVRLHCFSMFPVQFQIVFFSQTLIFRELLRIDWVSFAWVFPLVWWNWGISSMLPFWISKPLRSVLWWNLGLS